MNEQSYKYQEYLARHFENKGAEIGSLLDENTNTKLKAYSPEALEIWDSAMNQFATSERTSGVPFVLNEKPKLYALDGVVVADLLGISPIIRRPELEIFSLYYLSVHLFDDIIEDPQKFYSKFTYGEDIPVDLQQKATGMSFALHTMTTVERILSENADVYTPTAARKLRRDFTESLSTQTRFFTMEKNNLESPVEVREMKQRQVSGESTSFLATALQLDKIYGKQKGRHLRKMLWYLGSLTQFTDDLRDYHEDMANGNANLLISMEANFGVEARTTFIGWYVQEEASMLDELEKSGLLLNPELLKAIPWHPFFLKQLTQDI